MKFLLGIIAVLVLLCSFLGYKTYDLSEEKATLGVVIADTQKALESSEKAMETEKQSCSLTDLINTEYQEQKKEHSDKKDSILDELNKLTPSPKPAAKQETKINEKPNALELDIDSPLPTELRMLLDKACNPNKDGVCVYAQ